MVPADGSLRTAGTAIVPQRAVGESGQGASAHGRLRGDREQQRQQRRQRRRPAHSGMLPCRRLGRSTRLVSAVSSASISTGRVRDGRMTSST